MSYFPTDIPFMSDDELIENGLKKPKIIKGTDLARWSGVGTVNITKAAIGVD